MISVSNRHLKLIAGLVLLSLLGTLSWLMLQSYSRKFMPVRYVRVSGVFEYLAKQQIQEAIEPLTTTDFVSADIQAIDDAATALPWVAEADVKRVWPDIIAITITEQKPLFRWGEKELLNIHGELFRPEKTDGFSALAKISGPEGQEKSLYKVMLGLMAEVEALSLDLREFHVNERRSWELVFGNGMLIQLGRREPARNFQRFVQTLPVLGPDRIDAIERVDLRYPNGYSVTWKKNQNMDMNRQEKNQSV